MVFAMNSRYYRQQVEQAISGAEGMANNLPLSSLRDFFFTLPPSRAEAGHIAKKVQSETLAIEVTTSRVEREIALLNEYRTRLIADVVTGKLDVREVATGLPEPTESIDGLRNSDYVESDNDDEIEETESMD